MTRNEIKNALLDLLYDTQKTAQNEAFDKYVEFQKNRGEYYSDEMLRMENGWIPGTDTPYDKEELLFEFFEKTGLTSDNLKDFVDQDELYKYGDLLEEQKEAINQLLSQEEYKGITLSQIMTLKKIQTAKEQNWEEEDKYGDTGVSIDMIVNQVVNEENRNKEQNLYFETFEKLCNPENIIKELSEKLNVKNLNIDNHDISTIQNGLSLDKNGYASDIRLQYETKNNRAIAKYIDFITAQIAIETEDIGEINKETLKILYDNNYKGEIKDSEKSKLYTAFCNDEKRKEEETKSKLEQEFKELNQEPQAVEEQREEIEEEPQIIEQQDEEIEEEPQIVEEQNEEIEEEPQIIEQQDEVMEEEPQEEEKQSEEKEEQPQVVENQNQIIEEQNDLIEKQQQTIEKQQQIIEKQQQSQEIINELQAKIQELEEKNAKQIMVIKALNNRTVFLENIIKKQEACIHKIMNNFRSAKNSLTNALVEVKPKKFFEKFISRFTRNNDSKFIEQANIVNNLETESEKGVRETLVGENAVGSTEMYVKDQIRQMTSANRGREEEKQKEK